MEALMLSSLIRTGRLTSTSRHSLQVSVDWFSYVLRISVLLACPLLTLEKRRRKTTAITTYRRVFFLSRLERRTIMITFNKREGKRQKARKEIGLRQFFFNIRCTSRETTVTWTETERGATTRRPWRKWSDSTGALSSDLKCERKRS